MSNSSRHQAEAQVQAIVEYMAAYRESLNAPGGEITTAAWDGEVETLDSDSILTRLYENALEVRRWNPDDDGEGVPDWDWMILLCTGGPAVRLVVRVDGRWSMPAEVRLQHSDWFEGWTDTAMSDDEEDAALSYSRILIGE